MLLELFDVYTRSDFEVSDGRVRVYLDGKLAAEVVFYSEELFRKVVAALAKSGKLRQHESG